MGNKFNKVYRTRPPVQPLQEDVRRQLDLLPTDSGVFIGAATLQDGRTIDPVYFVPDSRTAWLGDWEEWELIDPSLIASAAKGRCATPGEVLDKLYQVASVGGDAYWFGLEFDSGKQLRCIIPSGAESALVLPDSLDSGDIVDVFKIESHDPTAVSLQTATAVCIYGDRE